MLVSAGNSMSFDDILDTTRSVVPTREDPIPHPFRPVTSSGPVVPSPAAALAPASQPARAAAAPKAPIRPTDEVAAAPALGEPGVGRHATPVTAAAPESFGAVAPPGAGPVGAQSGPTPWQRADQIRVAAIAVEQATPVRPQASAPAPVSRRRQSAPPHRNHHERAASVTALPTQPVATRPESDVPASVTPLPTRAFVKSQGTASAGSDSTPAAEETSADLTMARPPGAVAADKPIDGKFTVRAFRVLPTLWQHVLWMTSVDQYTTAETAAKLQLSRGVTAAAVLHAREGLRHEWLSALLNERDLAISCSSVIQFMHAYACDVATSAETELIEQHLHRCGRCTTITDEFARLPERLPDILGPMAEAGIDVFNAGPESGPQSTAEKPEPRRRPGRHMA